MELNDKKQVNAFAQILRRMGVFFNRLYNSHSSADDVFSKQERLTLDILEVLGACNMGEISRYLGLGQSSTTPLIDGLEKQGIVSRLRSQKDRRVWLVQLTEKGKKVSKSREDKFRKVAVEMLTTLDDSERKVLIELLETIPTSVSDSGL